MFGAYAQSCFVRAYNVEEKTPHRHKQYIPSSSISLLCLSYFIYMNISIRKRPSITRKSSLKQKKCTKHSYPLYSFVTSASVLNVCFTVIKNTPFRASVLSNFSFSFYHLHFVCIQNYSRHISMHTYLLDTI